MWWKARKSPNFLELNTEGNMNACSKCHGNPSTSCLYWQLKTKAVFIMLVLWEKWRDHLPLDSGHHEGVPRFHSNPSNSWTGVLHLTDPLTDTTIHGTWLVARLKSGNLGYRPDEGQEADNFVGIKQSMLGKWCLTCRQFKQIKLRYYWWQWSVPD